jgi:cytochrome o ubiquinol oxidase operon protein cyoD
MLDAKHSWNQSNKPLCVGFCLSALFILIAYWIAEKSILMGAPFLYAIFALAGAQALVQLVFFFHLGIESKPRWNLMTFLFMVLVILVVFGGSLWIMENLNYAMMPGM